MARMARAVGIALLILASAAEAREKFVSGPAAHRAGSEQYRVTLALIPGDDAAAVAGQLEATYGLRFARAEESAPSEWTVIATESRARLLSADPHVAAVTSSPAQEIAPQDVGSSWTSGTYQYDGSGSIKTVGSDAYVYDPAGRIVSSTAGPGHRQEYTYDGFGNVLTITTDGDTANKIELGVDRKTNQASKPDKGAYGSYDLAGNMTSFAGSATFAYDGLGMITDSTVAGERKVYLYTPDDERIAAIWVVGGVEQRSEWTLRGADQKVLRRFVRTGGKWSWDEDYIYRGGQLLAAEVNRPEKILRFHLDHLGTPRLITGNGGAEVSRHTYYPFGREVTPSTADTERLKFTGHERDRANLDYMHARYYTPVWGRFLSVDPVIDFKTNLRNPQGWNRYFYVRNNPMRWTDPTGKVIEYDESFRKRVKEDAVFRAAFEAWKKTPSGQKQWQTMARDKDTKYTFSVAKVVYQPSLLSDKFAVNGMTVPPSYAARENKYGQLNHPATKSTINADRMEEGGTARTQARTIAGALFEEAAHAIDLGGSGRTEWGANKAEEGFHADPPTEPRWIRYMRELLTVLPPED